MLLAATTAMGQTTATYKTPAKKAGTNSGSAASLTPKAYRKPAPSPSNLEANTPLAQLDIKETKPQNLITNKQPVLKPLATALSSTNAALETATTNKPTAQTGTETNIEPRELNFRTILLSGLNGQFKGSATRVIVVTRVVKEKVAKPSGAKVVKKGETDNLTKGTITENFPQFWTFPDKSGWNARETVIADHTPISTWVLEAQAKPDGDSVALTLNLKSDENSPIAIDETLKAGDHVLIWYPSHQDKTQTIVVQLAPQTAN
jgi:hypothetical protein